MAQVVPTSSGSTPSSAGCRIGPVFPYIVHIPALWRNHLSYCTMSRGNVAFQQVTASTASTSAASSMLFDWRSRNPQGLMLKAFLLQCTLRQENPLWRLTCVRVWTGNLALTCDCDSSRKMLRMQKVNTRLGQPFTHQTVQNIL